MRHLFYFGICLFLCFFSVSCDNSSSDDEAVESRFYRDADGDGYGDSDASVLAVECPSGYVDNSEDCDDSDGELNPGLGTCTLHRYYEDQDGDGYGNPDACVEAYKCPGGYVEDNTDSNDLQGGIH